jgi:hypothetical protein
MACPSGATDQHGHGGKRTGRFGYIECEKGEVWSNMFSARAVCLSPEQPANQERLVIYCRTTSASAAHATHCATFCTPCQPLLRAFSGWIRSPPPSPANRHWVYHPVQGYLVYKKPEISKRSVSVSYLGGPMKKLSENARCPFVTY